MFVKKKDGKRRLCADYPALNEVPKKDQHPLPLISKALDRLGGAKSFTKLDIKDAYHNFRIREEDEWKTTFSTKLGTYEYLVMPFGLCNAPAAFQRWINAVLMEHIDMCCIVYLDNVLIYSNTLQQHRKEVSDILKAIRKSGMKVKPSKCVFNQSEPEYLGFIIGQGVKTDSVKTQAIWDWTAPKRNGGHPMLLRFLQLLPRIYRRFQQDSLTTIRKDKKGMHWQLGVGRQRAKSIRRTKDKAHHSTSTGLLRPPRTDQNRNRRLKICLLRHTISTMPGRKMETGGIPNENHIKCRMQLRYTR